MRAALRARRDAHLLSGDASFPAALPDALLALLGQAGMVAGYVPIGSEIDPALLLAAAIAAGVATALPVTTSREAPIRFARWSPGDPLEAGPYGLRQPTTKAETVAPDLVLAPMLGFDRALNRLGQGAGHYDRAFVALPDARRIGLAWSVQEVDGIVADPWDMPLHALLTEREWIEA